jgi:hypothetical protein
MGSLSGSEFGHVQFDWNSGMRIAFEDRAKAILSAGADGKVLEAIGLGWQTRALRLRSGYGKRGNQQAQISTGIVHRSP